MGGFILIDGRPYKEGLPLRSLFYGEGVFETFRWRRGFPVFWDRHVERFKRGAGVLRIPSPDREYIAESVERAVLESGINDAYVKVCLLSQGSPVYYENPSGYSLLIIVREYSSPHWPIKACVSSFRRVSSSPIVGIKSLNYLENVMARREAMESGFNEALFLNERGEVCEGSVSNIFWLKGDVLFTPSLECGVLPGVIRGAVFELARGLGMGIKEGRFYLDSLTSSQGVFFTNSLIGAIPASRINGFEIPYSSQGFLRIKKSLLERLMWV